MEEKLLTLINRDWTSPAMDGLMAAMSSMRFWAAPLIVIAAALAVYGGFRARAMLVVLAVTVLVSDCVIGNGLKHIIGRPRPNEVVAGVRIVALNLRNPMQRLAASLGGHPDAKHPWVTVTLSRPDPDLARGRSFPSDHTLNNMCAAVVLVCFYRRAGWLFFIPAALVAYSRVYVGSHWPSDVAISIVLGIGLALMLLAAYEWLWRTLGPRLAPRLHTRHPGLWGGAAA